MYPHTHYVRQFLNSISVGIQFSTHRTINCIPSSMLATYMYQINMLLNIQQLTVESSFLAVPSLLANGSAIGVRAHEDKHTLDITPSQEPAGVQTNLPYENSQFLLKVSSPHFFRHCSLIWDTQTQADSTYIRTYILCTYKYIHISNLAI